MTQNTRRGRSEDLDVMPHADGCAQSIVRQIAIAVTIQHDRGAQYSEPTTCGFDSITSVDSPTQASLRGHPRNIGYRRQWRSTLFGDHRLPEIHIRSNWSPDAGPANYGAIVE